MGDKPLIPRFRLETVHTDGSREEPQLFELHDMADHPGCRMGRRGFLLTSAIGAGLLAALPLGCDSKPEKKALPDSKNPPAPRIEPGTVTKVAAHLKGANAVAFSPDGTMLASVGGEGAVKLWSIPECALLKVLRGHTRQVNAAAFSPDGALLATGSTDGTMRLWDMPSGALRATRANASVLQPRSLVFSPDGSFLTTSGTLAKGIQVWSLPSLELRATLEKDESVYAHALSPDGKMLACSTHQNPRRKLAFLSFPTGEPLKDWPGSYGGLAFSPDGEWLAVCGPSSMDGVSFREMPSGERRRHIFRSTPLSSGLAAFSPDGRWFSVVYQGQDVLLLAKPYQKTSMNLRGHGSRLRHFAFSGDGRHLATAAEDGSVCLWELPTNGKPASCKAFLFDPEATRKTESVIQATLTDKSTYVGSCGDPLPPGAVCTCNCVSGKYSPPPPPKPRSTGRGGGGGGCRCNKICTCIPIK